MRETKYSNRGNGGVGQGDILFVVIGHFGRTAPSASHNGLELLVVDGIVLFQEHLLKAFFPDATLGLDAAQERALDEVSIPGVDDFTTDGGVFVEVEGGAPNVVAIFVGRRRCRVACCLHVPHERKVGVAGAVQQPKGLLAAGGEHLLNVLQIKVKTDPKINSLCTLKCVISGCTE